MKVSDRHTFTLAAFPSIPLSGFEKIVQMLIRNGANVNIVNDEKYSPLMAAAAEGHENIVRVLIEKGADINAVGVNNNTALMFSIFQGIPRKCKTFDKKKLFDKPHLYVL